MTVSSSPRPDAARTVGDTRVVCVDKKRQWSKWRDVWHSSTLYMLGAPVRGVRGLFGSKQPVA